MTASSALFRIGGGRFVLLVAMSLQGQTASVDPLAVTYLELQAVTISDQPWATGPMDQVAPVMRRYRDQLWAMTEAAVGRYRNAREVQQAIEAGLHRAGIRIAPDIERGEKRPYGLVRQLEVRQPPERPDLLYVAIHLRLATHVDSSAALFRRSDGTRILYRDHAGFDRWELAAYSIEPPQFSAPDPDGSSMMLVIASSALSANGSYMLDAEVARLDAKGSYAKTVWKREFHAKLQKWHEAKLTASALTLDIEDYSYNSTWGGTTNFPYRYEWRQGAFHRVEPYANSPVQFTEVWSRLPWTEAEAFVAPPAKESLRQYHARENHAWGPAAMKCGNAGRQWLVPLGLDEADGYMLIEDRGGDRYRLLGLLAKVREGCRYE